MDDWIGGKEVRVFKGFRVGRDFKVVGRVGGVFFTRGQDALAPAGFVGFVGGLYEGRMPSLRFVDADLLGRWRRW